MTIDLRCYRFKCYCEYLLLKIRDNQKFEPLNRQYHTPSRTSFNINLDLAKVSKSI